jgi:hypothetical protein
MPSLLEDQRYSQATNNLLGAPDPNVAYSTLLPLGREKDTGDTVLAWPNAVRSAVDAFTLPGRVMQGERPSPREVTEAALEFGFLGAPAGMAMAPRGALGMFAGKSAKTADMDALAKAQAMDEAGESARDIWDQTGWFKGADDEWRFEIDDTQSGLSRVPSSGEETTIGNAFTHDKLLRAYPSMQETLLTNEAAGRYRAGYRPDADKVYMPSDMRAGENDSILHELQHAVQNREGFSSGAGTYAGYENRVLELAQRRKQLFGEDFNDEMEELEERITKEAPDLNVRTDPTGTRKSRMYRKLVEQDPEIYPLNYDLFQIDDRLRQLKIKGKENYRRSAGEVEARNVQTRRDMTPEQRRATPPWETEDVPRDQQIIRRR